MLQEDICSPEDILLHGEEQDGSITPLACTVTALLAHATCTKDIASYYDDNNDVDTLELNYQKQLRRYSDERSIRNFNAPENIIDETDEYQLSYENNNAEASFSPIYANEVRNRGPYYHKNKVQFVTPFCNVLKSDSLEIYDMDEVDSLMEIRELEAERYDRGKMNLDIQNNLNGVIENPVEVENKTMYTCLCLGVFVISTIFLIIYPL